MSDPIRFGVLGCADIAIRRVLPAFGAAGQVALVAVASRTPASARAVAERFGCLPVEDYSSLLNRRDLDAVYIPLPNSLHFEWTRRALEAGKHVLCEKPLTDSRAEAESLVQMAASAGLVLMENIFFVNHSQHDAIRDMISAGRIGRPRVLTARFGIPPLPPGNIRNHAALGGGALLDVGVYPIKAATYFLGHDLDVIGSVLYIDPHTGVDVAGQVLLASQEGVTAELSFGFAQSYESTYSIWGSRARLTLDRAFTPPPRWQPRVVLSTFDQALEMRLPADDQVANTLMRFAHAVTHRGGLPGPEIVGQAALLERVGDRAVRIPDAAHGPWPGVQPS